MRYTKSMENTTQENNRLMKMAGLASMVTAVGLIILKLITFLLTGSMAILSSLFDSIQDSMTSTVNMIAIRHAVEPADKEHSFGHGKAQALGGVSQAFIIAVASLFLLKESCMRLFDPQPITQIGLGLAITVFAIVATGLLIRFQRYVIAKTNSLSIKADMAHYTGDILMNVGVMVSMVAAYYLKWFFVDALFGIGVAIY
ncbi:MAG: cation diffusion facilitator family transporter, partial [Alphaproteobacteria bacterium]